MKDEEKFAGFWGNYHCDIPPWTVENMFEYISKNEEVKKKLEKNLKKIPKETIYLFKFDYVYWTGDLPPQY